jgi:hypothetical protein
MCSAGKTQGLSAFSIRFWNECQPFDFAHSFQPELAKKGVQLPNDVILRVPSVAWALPVIFFGLFVLRTSKLDLVAEAAGFAMSALQCFGCCGRFQAHTFARQAVIKEVLFWRNPGTA